MPLQIVRQDVTKMRVDAIVNPTNEEMVGYSGTDLAIHTAAGAELDEECKKLAPLRKGQAKLSGAYGLPCKYVIHTCCPVWQGGTVGERAVLRSCYLECLKLAVENGCSTVAFPLIGSGAHGYPKDRAVRTAAQTITDFLFEHELTVYLCVYDRPSYSISRRLYWDIVDFIGDRSDVRESSKAFYREEIQYNMRMPKPVERRIEASVCEERIAPCPSDYKAPIGLSLREYIKQMDKSFAEKLFDLIDKSGMTDVECYKKANVDKRTFSKIKSNKDYKPSKQTVIAFAISLRLDMDATQELLATAGFTLSESKVFDMIIMYFIYNGKYDIFEINEALFEFDQMLLGV